MKAPFLRANESSRLYKSKFIQSFPHSLSKAATLSHHQSSTMEFLLLTTLALFISVVFGQTISPCITNCVVSACPNGVDDITCACNTANLITIAACIAVNCSPADQQTAAGLISVCRISACKLLLKIFSLHEHYFNSDPRSTHERSVFPCPLTHSHYVKSYSLTHNHYIQSCRHHTCRNSYFCFCTN